MPRPTQVRSLPGYRIRLEYDDGVSGEIDLSHLAGRGLFRAWERPGFFEDVRIDAHRAIAWGDEIDMCRYALYMELTGKTWEELPEEVEAAVGDA